MPIVVTTEWLRELVPTDLPAREIGERLSDVGLAVDVYEEIASGPDGRPEARLELEAPTNRGDCWSIVGVARELAATLGLKMKLPATKLRTSGRDAKASIKVEVGAPDLCPRYTARLIRGVKVGPSPDWMQRRLEAVGIRPISNVVDVTNYVLVEWGQPLHAFDMELLAGDRKRSIIVRRAGAGEKLPLLDETTKELCPEDLVIATPGRAVALAGVMGGADTEIRDSTTDVLLESAEFNQISTRRTARRHGVATESSVRFEHGVDPVGVELASRRAAYLLMKHAGGKVAPGVVGPDPKWKAPQITLRHARVSRLLCGSSATIPDKDIRRTLGSLGLELVREKKAKGDVVSTWRVPPWRRELAIEVDLIEEVGRVYGYGRLPGRPTMRVFPVKPHPMFEARRRARDVLTALGYTEVCGASFFSPDRAASKGMATYRVCNPARADEGVLRTGLVPSLLAAKLANQSLGTRRVRLFEVAPVCAPGSEKASERIAILDDGPDDAEAGPGDGGSEDALLRVKGALEEVVRRLDGSGAGAKALAGAQTVALLPQADADAWGLKTRPALVEADLAALAEGIGHAPQATDLPVFPGIARDAALVMPEERTWAEVESAAADLAHEWRSAPEFVSLYRGEQVGAGRKSVAFRVVYRSADRTLTDDDVKGPHAEFVQELCAALGAEVRG
ncbi:MAG: phenylalanine--tRNA ligase subunit beta [Planctomycetota bacterium]